MIKQVKRNIWKVRIGSQVHKTKVQVWLNRAWFA